MPPNGTVPRNPIGEALERRIQSTREALVARERIERSHEQVCPPDSELDGLFQAFAQHMPRSEAVPLVVEREEKPAEEDDQGRRKTGNFLTRIIGRNIAGWQMGREGRVVPKASEIEERRKKNLTHTRCIQELMPDDMSDDDAPLMGWPIRIKGMSGTIPYVDKDGVRYGAWAGLVIDVNGRAWFARDAHRIAPDGESWDKFRTDTDEAPVAIEGDLSRYEIHRTPMAVDTLSYLVANVSTGLSRNVVERRIDEETGLEVDVIVEDEVVYPKRLPHLGEPTGRNLRESIMWFCGIHNVAPDELTEVLAQAFTNIIVEAHAKAEREASEEDADRRIERARSQAG